jgi:hypothetical protein
LRNRDEKIVLADQGVAVPEFAADIDLHRSPNHFFQEIFTDQPRMPRCTAGHDPDPVHCRKFFGGQTDIGKIGFTGFI